MKRPIVSQIVIDIISQNVDYQDMKGMQKYNQTIDQASDSDYDWNVMAIEELVDGMKYTVKEIQKMKKEIILLNKENRRLKFENQHVKMLLSRWENGKEN